MMFEISAIVVALILIIGGFFLGKGWGFKALLLTPLPLLIAFIVILALSSSGGGGSGIAGAFASLIAVAIIAVIFFAGLIATLIFGVSILVGALIKRRYKYYW